MKIRTTLALGACLSVASLGASAQISVEGDVETAGDGYVNVGGMVLKSGLGECFQSGTNSEDNTINACAGISDEDVAADAAAKAAEDAAAKEAEEAAAKAAQAPAAPPAPTAKIDTREFSELALFDSNSAALNAEGNQVMEQLFSELAEYKGITGIEVIGHTDSLGSEAYNQALSEQRAAAVAAEISNRYPDARIDVKGMGESSPLASNASAEGRQQNRRVEIEITATRMTFN